MNKIILPAIIIILFSLFSFHSFAQDRMKIETLKNQLKRFESSKKEMGANRPKMHDTVEVKLLESLAMEYFGINPDTAMEFGTQALSICERINTNLIIPNFIIGRAYEIKADFTHALVYYQNSLNEAKKGDDKMWVAKGLFNMGNVYRNLSNYPTSIRFELDALKIFEEMGDKLNMAKTYSSLGLVYSKVHNYSDALQNHSMALKIFTANGQKDLIANTYFNIGLLNMEQKNYDDAITKFEDAQKIFLETGNKLATGNAICNIGKTYERQGDFSEALLYLRDAEKIFEEVGAEDNIANVYANLAKTYLKLGKTKEAIKYANNALTLSIVIGDKDQLKDAYENLAEVNAAMNNFKAAYKNEVLFKQVYDTIYNKENEKKLTQLQMQYDFDKKQDSTQAEQVRRDDVSHEVIKRQKQLKNAFIVGFVLLCLLALILYNRFRLKRKANLALEEKNQIISHEKLRSDNLLLNILPEEVAEELKNNGKIAAREFESVTVMFTDFKDFTKISEQLTAAQLVTEIDACFSAFDNIVAKYNIEKIKTIGDAYMCAGGLPKWSSNHAEDTVRAAIEIREFMLKHNNTKRANGEIPFEIRIGINTGHVVAGIVGVKKFAYDIWGDTVNLASRMESSSEPGKVNISGSTYELVKHKFTCEHRGKIMTKSKGEVEMYFVS